MLPAATHEAGGTAGAKGTDADTPPEPQAAEATSAEAPPEVTPPNASNSTLRPSRKRNDLIVPKRRKTKADLSDS
jgi:hypothetical protein